MSARRFVRLTAGLMIVGTGLVPLHAQDIPTPNPDLNDDGIVDDADLAIVRAAFGRLCGDPLYSETADLDRDFVVDVWDLSLVPRYYGLPMVDITATVSPAAPPGEGYTSEAVVSFTLRGTRIGASSYRLACASRGRGPGRERDTLDVSARLVGECGTEQRDRSRIQLPGAEHVARHRTIQRECADVACGSGGSARPTGGARSPGAAASEVA